MHTIFARENGRSMIQVLSLVRLGKYGRISMPCFVLASVASPVDLPLPNCLQSTGESETHRLLQR